MVSTTTQPSRISSPPNKAVEYKFSFARSTGEMRWQHQGYEWRCKSIVGEVWSRRTDGEGGKLFLVCQLSIDEGGNATVWGPEGALLAALQAEPISADDASKEWNDFPQGRFSKRWRLCLNRALKKWRIRDDDVDSEKIWNTNGYRGLMRVRWMDSGPHLHVEGKPRLDPKTGVVQFDG